jgi:hypothetical protein
MELLLWWDCADLGVETVASKHGVERQRRNVVGEARGSLRG